MKILQPLDISVNPASAPLITNSDVKVSNLNVDLLDGLDSTYFASKADVDANKTGFINRVDSLLSFDDGTRTFTIAPSSTSFSFYANGTLFTKNSPQSVVITDSEGQWFVYFDLSGNLTATQTFTVSIITEFAFVSVLYWDATNNIHILLGDERHGYLMDTATHLYLHNTVGSIIDNPLGLAVTDIVADGSGDLAVHAQIGISGGGIWDEDIEHVIATKVAPASLPVFYLTGSGVWRRKTASSYPLLYGITGTKANYNLFSGGVWTVEEVGNADFVLSHLFATNDPNQYIIVIAGQNDYATIAQAREGSVTEVKTLFTVGLPTQEFVWIGTLIFETNTGNDNVPKSKIRTTDAGDSYIDGRTTRLGVGGSSATVGWGNITGLIASQVDLQVALDEKEASLGNPASDGLVLSSTAAGVRSWVDGGVCIPRNLIASPLTVPADTSYIVMSELRVESDLTNNGNVGIL